MSIKVRAANLPTMSVSPGHPGRRGNSPGDASQRKSDRHPEVTNVGNDRRSLRALPKRPKPRCKRNLEAVPTAATSAAKKS